MYKCAHTFHNAGDTHAHRVCLNAPFRLRLLLLLLVSKNETAARVYSSPLVRAPTPTLPPLAPSPPAPDVCVHVHVCACACVHVHVHVRVRVCAHVCLAGL